MKRWTAFSEHWQEDVGCVAVESDDGLIFFDPLDPPGEADHTFVTVFFHAREARGRVWAPKAMVKRLQSRGVEVTDVFEPGDELPGGVECFPTARSGEVVYWLPSEQALVVGDVLLGAGAKPKPTEEPLRLCPDRWVGGGKTQADLRASLQPLLELPVEQVLVSHGEPILTGGRAILAGLLAALVLFAAGCGGGSGSSGTTTKPACPKTERALARLVGDIAAIRTAKRGPATDAATDRFLLHVATAPISNLQRNRLIDHAAAAVAPKCQQCFLALESARPIPSIRAGESGCPTGS